MLHPKQHGKFPWPLWEERKTLRGAIWDAQMAMGGLLGTLWESKGRPFLPYALPIRVFSHAFVPFCTISVSRKRPMRDIYTCCTDLKYSPFQLPARALFALMLPFLPISVSILQVVLFRIVTNETCWHTRFSTHYTTRALRLTRRSRPSRDNLNAAQSKRTTIFHWYPCRQHRRRIY